MKYKFKVGDKVRVINEGKLYDTYNTMANKMSLTNWFSNRDLPDNYNQLQAVIISIIPHENSKYEICCGIEFSNGEQFIMDEKGLELISKPKYNDNDIITVDVKTLRQAYDNDAKEEHRKFIDQHFSFSGQVKVKHLRELHGMVCSRWKKIIETNHPELFEEDKYFDVSDFKAYINGDLYIERRGSGEYENKGFYLGQGTNWEIITDSKGRQVLLPTKKQK